MTQLSAENFENTGPVEKEKVASVPQREQLESTTEPPWPEGKGTEPSVQNIRSYGGRKVVKLSESRSLARERDQSGSMERTVWTSP